MNRVQDLMNKIDTDALKCRSLTDWRPILADECQVYVFGENYLAKRFDSICYKFCEKNEAKEILVDNLYALLRYKYFPHSTEEIDERINDIVLSFTKNLKTTLKKVTFDEHSDSIVVNMLPDGCIAFRNGVFNFKTNSWLFRYDVIQLEKLHNTIYMYDPNYVIFWYLDYLFEPLPVDINTTSLSEFVDIMKNITKTDRNYCFELLYNISHNVSDDFDRQKFEHVCEILGYTCLQSFNQHFIMLIGNGQNGKNSLFDGCFTNRLIPRPASNDLASIETDRFITGALENKSHNIYLESTTEAKTYTESKTIKNLTGSMYQTIESKGVNKYSGIINCKFLFSANDQDKLKFGDTTTGFRRRINMLEIFYQWDKNKSFLKRGDYYDTTFSDSLDELKQNVANTTAFIYFAMYGIKLATKNFTRNFQFDYNDWNTNYLDIDSDLRDKISSIKIDHLVAYMQTKEGAENCKIGLYDESKVRLYISKSVGLYGVDTFQKLIDMFSNPADYISYFSENSIYISLKILQSLTHTLSSPKAFTQTIKKLYNINKFESLGPNLACIKCTFIDGRLRIVK